jgi:hypothetical protein
MKAIAQHTLTRKLLLLFVLAGMLAYLRTPTKAIGGACQQLCAEIYNACQRSCFKNVDPPACSAECTVQYNTCLANCN